MTPTLHVHRLELCRSFDSCTRNFLRYIWIPSIVSHRCESTISPADLENEQANAMNKIDLDDSRSTIGHEKLRNQIDIPISTTTCIRGWCWHIEFRIELKRRTREWDRDRGDRLLHLLMESSTRIRLHSIYFDPYEESSFPPHPINRLRHIPKQRFRFVSLSLSLCIDRASHLQTSAQQDHIIFFIHGFRSIEIEISDLTRKEETRVEDEKRLTRRTDDQVRFLFSFSLSRNSPSDTWSALF